MIRRLAEFLLRSAVRRWPAELHDELSREWHAELHVLAERGQRWRMLRFAASLAASRAGAPVVDRAVLHRRLRWSVGVLLLAPPACVGVVALAATVMSTGYLLVDLKVSWATALQLPLWSALTAGLGVLLAVLAARGARRGIRIAPMATALGVVLPIGATALPLAYGLASGAGDLARTVPGLLLWLGLLALALWGAGALARHGRRRLAWAVGVAGALVAADAAVVLAVVSTIPATDPGSLADGLPADAVDRISAPLWLFTCWTDSSFGLPRPTDWERFLITDRVLVEPIFYLACTPYALTYAIGTVRPADPVAVGSPEPVSSPA